MPRLSPSASAKRLAEHDADILGGVVEVDMQVALGLDLEVEQRVPGEGGQHVVEEADPGRDPRLAGAVEVEPDGDLRSRTVLRVMSAVRAMAG